MVSTLLTRARRSDAALALDPVPLEELPNDSFEPAHSATRQECHPGPVAFFKRLEWSCTLTMWLVGTPSGEFAPRAPVQG